MSKRLQKLPLGVELLVRGALLACLFWALMICAYLIPDAVAADNVVSSARMLQAEGPFPRVVKDLPVTQLDNWTESYILNMAVHQDGDPVCSAILNPYFENDQALANESRGLALIASVREGLGQKANCSYGRYWQGQMVFIRPLLAVMELRSIYAVMAAVMAVMFLRACWLLRKRLGAPEALAFIATMALVSAWILPFSTKFWFSFAVALAGMCLVLRSDPENLMGRRLPVLLFTLGAVTVYTDFLSTPLVSLGLPLTCAIVLARDELGEKGMGGTLRWLATCVASWLFGYLLLGAFNWAAYILASPSAAEAVGAIGIRLDHWAVGSGAEQGPSLNKRFDGIRMVIRRFLCKRDKAPVTIDFALIAAASALCAFSKGPSRPARAALVICALLPFVWWLLLSNSVATHAWAVYRTIAMTVFALLCAAILRFRDARDARA